MSIKKKMGIGILTGTLGLSLIGGGTWAAFNDVENTTNTFEAGTLDLTTDKTVLFELSNLKPGDYFTKTLKLGNNGSLAIDDIFLKSTVSGWVDVTNSNLPGNGVNSQVEFLKQFKVTIKRDNVSLGTVTADQLMSYTTNPREITGSGTNPALLSGEDMDIEIKVEFVNDPATYPNSRLHTQNKYQGEGAKISLKFEATQMPGEQRNNDTE